MPHPNLKAVDSLANQLPNPNFRDTRINENVLLSGPPNVDSDSDFNRNSSMMARNTRGKTNRNGTFGLENEPPITNMYRISNTNDRSLQGVGINPGVDRDPRYLSHTGNFNAVN
jgi:hypothetical protein